jgi:hypothetical protein
MIVWLLLPALLFVGALAAIMYVGRRPYDNRLIRIMWRRDDSEHS